MSRSRAAISSNMAGVGKYGLQGMQKSTGPAPSLSRVSAAIDGLCAAVLRNSEVTLPAKGTSVCGGPAGAVRARHAWAARAGERGPPMSTESGARPFSSCEGNVTAAAHEPNEWIVVVRYVSPGRSTVDGNDGWFGESGKCWVSRHSPSPCR